VGGRLLTLDDLPGAPNAGGSQVGGGYARLRATAQTLGVAIAPDAGENRAAALYVGGKLMRSEDWAKAAVNPFPAALKATPPGALLFRLAGADKPIADPAAWRDPVTVDRDISAADYLAGKGIDAASQRLVDIGLNGNALATYSMINLWRTLALFRIDAALGPVGGVEGGAQRLAEAMAAPLGEAVRKNAAVKSLAATRDGVTARLADGSELRGDFAVCAVPTPALRGIALETERPLAQQAAFDGLPYTQIVQLYLEPEVRFWESDGLPPDMWTDGPLERIFAVRDRATDAPNGLLLAWINGDGAGWLAGKSDADIEAAAAAALKAARPASQGKVKLRRVVRWTKDNPLAGGAYAHWAPGQVGRWAAGIAAPAGRLHFAGEHLASVFTGMEGAMESGEAAALAVMTAAGG
jgi:monoamine oxidase